MPYFHALASSSPEFVFVSALTVFLGLIDILFISYAYQSTLMKGASVQLVFGFEVNLDITFPMHVPSQI